MRMSAVLAHPSRPEGGRSTGELSGCHERSNSLPCQRMADAAVRAVVELAARQHGAVARHQLSAEGFDARRVATAVRSGWLAEPVPGVLVVTGAIPTWHQRLMIVTLACGGHAIASHRSAARLHRLDGFDHAGMAVIEVSVSRAHRVPLGGSVTHHVTPFDECDLTSVDGIPCTTIGRTLADLGSVVRDRRLVGRALTDARRRHIDLDRLRATAERLRRPGQSGTGVLTRLLDAIPYEGRISETWFEELIGLCLDDPALPKVVRQFPIRGDHGRIVARTDLGIPSVRLGLEAHSRRFHFGPLTEPLDEDRDMAAALCGWELLYLGWYAAKRPVDVLRVVKEVVRVRSCEVGALTPAS